MKQLPPTLASNPDAISLLNRHVEWLQSPVAAKVLYLLNIKVDDYTRFVATGAISSDVTAESVRIRAAQLQQLLYLKDLLYDTNKFVSECFKGTHTD